MLQCVANFVVNFIANFDPEAYETLAMATKSRVSEPLRSSQNQFQMVSEALLGMMWVSKSITEGARSSLEDYVGPLIDKKLVLNSKKVARSLQEKPACSEI